MNSYLGSPWFWWPIGIVLVLIIFFVTLTYRNHKDKSTKDVTIERFRGPTRNMTNSGLGGFFLPLASILLSDKIRADEISMALLGSSMVFSIVAVIIGMHLYSSVDSLIQSNSNGTDIVKGTAWGWIAEQSVVVVLTISSYFTLFLFLIFSPIITQNSDHKIDCLTKIEPQQMENIDE